MLELAVDPGQLFYTDDVMFVQWLDGLSIRVADERRRQNEQIKREAKRA